MKLSNFVRSKVEEVLTAIPTETPPAKPGYKTTEFGTSASLVSFLCTQAYRTNDPQWAWAAAVVVTVYTVARVIAKQQK
jgi:hypothetical protein